MARLIVSTVAVALLILGWALAVQLGATIGSNLAHMLGAL